MTEAPMPADKFWQIVNRAAKSDHDPEAHMEALRTILRELSLEEIIFPPSLGRRRSRDTIGAQPHGPCLSRQGGFETRPYM